MANLDANRLALAFAGATALIWILCSTLVAVMPGAMMSMTGHMLHGNMEGVRWTMTWTGFFIGLVSWVIWAAAAGWLIGWFYNRFGAMRSSSDSQIQEGL